MSMCIRTVKSKTNKLFVSSAVHPQTTAVMQTRAHCFGVGLVVGDHHQSDIAGQAGKLVGALVQYPYTNGIFEDFTELGEVLHANGGCLVVAADPVALVLARPPSDFGADIVFGSMQRDGVSMWLGGPSGAYMATSLMQVRRMRESLFPATVPSTSAG